MKRRLSAVLAGCLLLCSSMAVSAFELTDGTESAAETAQELLTDGAAETDVPADEFFSTDSLEETASELLLPETVPEDSESMESASVEEEELVEISEELIPEVGETAPNGLTYPLQITMSNVPSANLRTYLRKLDPDGDNRFSYEEAMEVTELFLCGYEVGSITSLQGLEYLTSLTYLDISYNEIPEIDLSMFPNLQTVNCNQSGVQTLNLSGLSELRRLDCAYNSLTSLDLGSNPKLTSLNCSGNQISKLSITHLKSLEWLLCNENCLTQLNVQGLASLKTLGCNGNALRSINLTGLTGLTTLSLNRNTLTSVDVTGLTVLTSLSLQSNSLSELNVLKNKNLTYLDCSYNKLKKLNVQPLTNLKTLDVRANFIPYKSSVYGRAAGITTFHFDEQKLDDEYRTEVTTLLNRSNGVEVRWKKAASAKKYYVYRKEITGDWTAWKNIATVSGGALTYTDTTAQSGMTYYYTVRATEVDSTVYLTDRVGMSIEHLRMPKIQAITNRSSGIYMTWNEVEGAETYQIFRRLPGGSWTSVGSVVGQSTTSFVDESTHTENAVLYEYTVSARGNRDGSAYHTSGTKMYRLRNVGWKSFRSLSGGRGEYYWSVNGSATGYRLQYATTADFSDVTTVVIKGYKNAFRTVRNLTAGTVYYARVQSYKVIDGKEYRSAWTGTRKITAK